jgi:ADP-ribose pyrophosphatase YjhB (NUDIX family)
VHVDDAVLEDVRARYGEPVVMPWRGEISEVEWSIATHNPSRTLDPSGRLALIRKPHFTEGVWRPPGGGVKPAEEFAAGAVREALEETGLRVALERYLVASEAVFTNAGRELRWRTHVLLARTEDEELEPGDPEEIAAARWGTLDELSGELREILLATGRAFWRYRVDLHDAALAALNR